MQQTLSQLSELNNDAIVESSRTARTLNDEVFGAAAVVTNGTGAGAAPVKPEAKGVVNGDGEGDAWPSGEVGK